MAREQTEQNPLTPTLRNQKVPLPYTPQELFERGNIRSFSGRSLQEIAFPLGGIGTGTVSLGGRGNLRDWEIFNRPAKGKGLPYTFFALWVQAQGADPIARVLEARYLPPYSGGFGLPTAQVAGLPRLAEARFTGAYPFAWIDFFDDTLPVQVSLEAFNPFIPMNDKDSGIPVALFRWRLKNTSSKPVSATIAFSLLNAVGYDGMAGLSNRYHSLFGKNLNEFVQQKGFSGLKMTSQKYPAEDPKFGSMAIATSGKNITYLTHWERTGWWDDLQNFWDDFRTDGLLPDGPSSSPSPDNQTDVGTLGVRVQLDPEEEKDVEFALAWHFPNLYNYWNTEEQVRGKRLGNFYATLFKDAWEVAEYTLQNLPRLEKETRLFYQTLFSSSLPSYVLDAVSSQASIIRTTTGLRTEDGRFNAFEGCGDNSGCCPMNCTHVWNYEQALAHLFPALERTMRFTDFQHNTRPDGNMAFRTLLPLVGALWAFKPAADGQMGTIMKLYREWKQSGDIVFLKEVWPSAKKALEFAWKTWDADQDGVMEGEQHNTYDIEFHGPNSMITSFYLGALRAGEEMAHALGDEESAQKYRRLFEKGRKKVAEELWNGEYYFQRIEDVNAYRYQYGQGCLSDQLLGQWFAHVVGLGYLLPPEQVKSAIYSVFRYNWRSRLEDHHNCQRTYALNDEKGLIVCSWPKGGRPRYPFPYSDEVWTGIEYQVAAHLIYEGFVEEGLAIVRGTRERYNGERRNPWDEVECGHHYARAMSSWSLLLALSGYHYHAPSQTLGFAPRLWPEDFQCFFTTAEGWGNYSQKRAEKRQEHRMEMLWGSALLKTLLFELPEAAIPSRFQILAEGEEISAQLKMKERTAQVELAQPLYLTAGHSIEVLFYF